MSLIESFCRRKTEEFLNDTKDISRLPKAVLSLIRDGWLPPGVDGKNKEVCAIVRKINDMAERT